MDADEKWMLSVQGSKDMRYVVSYDPNPEDGKKYKCTCKAFEFYYEERGPCKHIQWVLEGKIKVPS